MKYRIIKYYLKFLRVCRSYSNLRSDLIKIIWFLKLFLNRTLALMSKNVQRLITSTQISMITDLAEHLKLLYKLLSMNAAN